MNDEFVIYVDFDSTLFDTSAFSYDLWSVIAKKAGITMDQVKKDGSLHNFHPFLGGYEYEKHIARYQLDPDEMWSELDKVISQKNYLYSDSADFMISLQKDGYSPKILTFGEERYQLVKIRPTLKYLSDVTTLNEIDVVVVDKKKNQHILAFHAGRKGVLIDDKPNQELPPGFTEIHLNRDTNLVNPKIERGSVSVSNLFQAREMIDFLASGYNS